MELQLDEDLVENCLQSFHHGRPRGLSGNWFEDDDDFTATRTSSTISGSGTATCAPTSTTSGVAA